MRIGSQNSFNKPVTRIFDLLEFYKDEYHSISNLFNVKKEGGWVHYSAADYVHNSQLFSLGLLSSE